MTQKILAKAAGLSEVKATRTAVDTGCRFSIQEKMKYTEAKQKIAELTAKKSADYTTEDKQVANQIHLHIYKTPIADCNCTDKYVDAVVKMAIWFKNNKAFNNCHYTIQRGQAFMVGMTYYNNSNLTDAVAEELINTNPEARKYITRVELDDEEPTAAKPAEEKETNEEPITFKKRRK